MSLCTRVEITLEVVGLLLLFFFSSSYATEFVLPAPNEALLGQVKYISASATDIPVTIAEKYDLGVNAVIAANPGLTDTTVTLQKRIVKVATQFLLPPLPRSGIIINLPEMRLYY